MKPNNDQYDVSLSAIEVRMIISDMENTHYRYFNKNDESHRDLINRLLRYVDK